MMILEIIKEEVRITSTSVTIAANSNNSYDEVDLITNSKTNIAVGDEI